VVAVAQLVESRIVIPVVVGSSPISHPKNSVVKRKGYMLRLVTLFCFWVGSFEEILKRANSVTSRIPIPWLRYSRTDSSLLARASQKAISSKFSPALAPRSAPSLKFAISSSMTRAVAIACFWYRLITLERLTKPSGQGASSKTVR
jgi:hypothetical protein